MIRSGQFCVRYFLFNQKNWSEFEPFRLFKKLARGGGCSVPLAITSDNVFYAILKKIINIGFEMIQNISGDGEGNQAKKSWFGGSEYQVSDYL